MCLITEQQKPIKIRKDLTVYKMCNAIGAKLVKSIYHGDFTYLLGVTYETDFTFVDAYGYVGFSYDSTTDEAYGTHNERQARINSIPDLICVEEGFHSGTEINRFDNVYGNGLVLVKCTIPKGSLVYKDKTNLVVSNKIIINEII